MGGINISQKHNLINKSKSPLFYTLISVIILTILTILTIIAISIKLSFSNAAGEVEGANDTAIATLNNVDILQAGTGQSVTIKGETLNENDYGDNTTRRTILNNNVVRYNANYNVTKVGQITFSITLPANNTIDEATIAESQGCLPNLSKLESADITNSDGTITKSYTNNKATCVRNITTTGSTNWQITAYLWGANNTKIQPTLAVSGETSTIKPEEISVVGRPNYGVIYNTSADQGFSSGYNRTILPRIALYVPLSDSTGLLGVAPLDTDSLTIILDTSALPAGWGIYRQYSSFTGVNVAMSTAAIVTERSSDGKQLRISWPYAATAINKCATDDSYANMCLYAAASLYLSLPTSSLPDGTNQYTINIESIDGTIDSHPVQILPDRSYYTWTIQNYAFGNPYIWGDTAPYNIGWTDNWGDGNAIYAGQKVRLGAWIQLNTIPSSLDNVSTNLNYCVTWNPNEANIDDEATKATDVNSGSILSDYKVQYGVTGTDMSVLPSSSQQYCGKVGDENIPGQMMFFDTLEEANTYAKQDGLAVNAIRAYMPSASIDDGNGGSRFLVGEWDMKIYGLSNRQTMYINASAVLDQWAYRLKDSNKLTDEPVSAISPIIVPGLLSHTLTAEPSSTNPGKEDHITITTKTYNKDTNAKITVNLPTGLSIKPGTITIKDPNTGNPIPLIEGETSDYTVSLNTTSTTKLTNGSTVTFNLDNIAANHGINLTGYEPIYPGESGVTNIECNTVSNTTNSSDTNPTCHEVITTNNNNADDDPINDDLPIAADNNGNGIEHTHTPIEFDVVIDEDTPAPSTLTINSTASGTGTDYASSTFKSASDTIAVADPPRTFGYDLTTSSNYVYAGDNLTYNYQVSNLTNNEVTNLDLVTVLPYNEDSRGTTGLIDPTVPDTNPYTLTNLTTSLPDGAHLYYTIDTTAVRQIEQGKDTSALISDPSIIWQELDSNTIPTDIASKITALRLSIDNFAMDSKANFSITLTNILANNPTTDLQPSLASDITYLGYQAAGTPTLTSHTNLVKTSYEGNLLVLNPDKTAITTNLNPNEAKLGNGNVDNPDSLTNRLDITARTLNGYTVTMQVKGSSNSLLPISTNNTNRLIPAINTTPTAGLTGWAISLDTTNANPTWQAVPAIDSDTDQPTLPLAIYQTDGNGPKSLRLPIAYGVSISQNTIADTYRAEVVYTLTAEL